VNSITDILAPERIRLDLAAKKKKQAIFELAELFRPEMGEETPGLAKQLFKREKMSSTGIGHGIAIPHVMTELVDRTLMAIGRSVHEIPFDSVDNRPVRLFFLLLGPPGSTAAHLKTLSKLSRIVTQASLREALLEIQDPHEVIELLRSEEEV
jgi:mannitol/fructose-specific phosphotransferase system IIA component (Ntr-type)